MASINVTPQELKTTASTVEGNVGEYVNLYKKLISEVESLSAKWKGEGNAAYANQIRSFEPEFENLRKVLGNYVLFLREAGRIYGQTEDGIRENARKLASGR